MNLGNEVLIGLLFVLKCIYFMLPAYFANMMPVFVRKINFLNYPLDFGGKINGKPVLGKNKTWRGLVFGVVIAGIIFYLQQIAYGNDFFKSISLIDYTNTSILIGFGLGFGALLGDLIESFVKRRINIEPGEVLAPWDQLDFVIGALLFSFWLLSWEAVLVILVISPLLHVLVNYIRYSMKIKENKF